MTSPMMVDVESDHIEFCDDDETVTIEIREVWPNWRAVATRTAFTGETLNMCERHYAIAGTMMGWPTRDELIDDMLHYALSYSGL